jgi:uncharacterized protein YacL
MFMGDISNFQNTRDYLPIITGALITDMIALVLILAGYLNGKSIKEWYVTYGLSGVLVDTLSITIGIIFARLIYTICCFIYFSKRFLETRAPSWIYSTIMQVNMVISY